MRLVKRTVNFDDPGTYHLYFGDGTGRPGTLLTFFPIPNAARGRHGAGVCRADGARGVLGEREPRGVCRGLVGEFGLDRGCPVGECGPGRAARGLGSRRVPRGGSRPRRLSKVSVGAGGGKAKERPHQVVPNGTADPSGQGWR
ncbi:MAG: hypothetical protein LOD90_07570 [Symbiobacteriaceae bacterium]